MYYTPQGLKVRIEKDFIEKYCGIDINSFGCWLEFFETSRAIFSMVAFYILLFITPNTPMGMLKATVAFLLLYSILEGQLYFSPDILSNLFMMLFSWLHLLYLLLSRFFLPYIIAIILVIITKNFYVLFAFLIVKAVGYIMFTLIDKYISRKYDLPITGLEFFAFKLLSIFDNDKLSFRDYIKMYKEYLAKQVI